GREGGGALLELPQPLAEPLERRAVEAGADPARVHEATRLVVHPQQERAELFARSLGLREAGDDELLPREALHLEPVPAAARSVGRVLALGDDAFKPRPARAVVHLAAGRVEVLEVAQSPAVALEEPGERFLPLEQRGRA